MSIKVWAYDSEYSDYKKVCKVEIPKEEAERLVYGDTGNFVFSEGEDCWLKASEIKRKLLFSS